MSNEGHSGGDMGLKRIAGTRGGRVGGETHPKYARWRGEEADAEKEEGSTRNFSIKSHQTMIHRLLVTRGNQGYHESSGPVIGFSSKDVARIHSLENGGFATERKKLTESPIWHKKVHLLESGKSLSPSQMPAPH